MLTKAQRDKWADALESGKYEQNHGALIGWKSQTELKHCCIGVFAAELLGYETPEIINNFRERQDIYKEFDRMISCSYIDFEDTPSNYFINLNDVLELPFKSIAEKVRNLEVND